MLKNARKQSGQTQNLDHRLTSLKKTIREESSARKMFWILGGLLLFLAAIVFIMPEQLRAKDLIMPCSLASLVICCFACASIAKAKERSLWWSLAGLGGALFGGILILVAKDYRKESINELRSIVVGLEATKHPSEPQDVYPNA